MKQLTEEWFAARLGKVTASRIKDVMSRTAKNAYSSMRKTYMLELISERLSGTIIDHYRTPAMNWGVENEDIARSQYIILTNNNVEQVGFFPHSRLTESGASPDGIVGDDGLIEIKCPNTVTHVTTLVEKKIKNDYILQMQWQMACTGRAWCDFVSFDPRLPERYSIYIQRVERDDNKIQEIESEVEAFLLEIDTIMEALENGKSE